ncbi:hypothetical protein Syun_013981 [Stephania yunnanensis]|uniref:GPN-loop GTPase n=1 Tax=Stephania yunnanensis TaxID=152371 RepID=A0AAP0PBG4_9MAGN
MDIDSDFDYTTTKGTKGEPELMQMDSAEVSTSKGKETEDISKSMEKLGIEESSSQFKRKPVIIIVVGMAGEDSIFAFSSLTLAVRMDDPGSESMFFGLALDIHPSGLRIVDIVISVIEKRADQLDYVLVDTPGQIEIFTWSASGSIITEAFASTFPTVIAYVVDTPRAVKPVTFMSNMLYACSILYKTRLPLVLTFNKTDVTEHKFALEWMEDFEKFQAAIASDSSYSATLSRSLSLALDEFYRNLHSVGVSALSGAGMDAFFKVIDASANEFIDTYKAGLDKRWAEKQRLEEQRRRENMEKLRKDMEESRGETVVLSTGLKNKETSGKTMMDEEDEEDVEENYIETSTEEEKDEIDEDEDEEVSRFSF